MPRLVHILLCTILLSTVVSAQVNLESNKVILPSQKLSLSDLIETIEDQTEYFVSYNTAQIDLTTILAFDQTMVELNEIKKNIEERVFTIVEIDNASRKFIILPPQYKSIYGIIRDAASLETLIAVNVVSRGNLGTTTNKDGYFYLRISSETDSIHISYLGYRTKALHIPNQKENKVVVDLVSDNVLPDIVIQANSKIAGPSTFNPKDINIDKTSPIKGMGGRSDLISSIKHISGISVGSEAQNGFTVRGGGTDQNLVLLDGLPVYGTSHLGGLSSIFVDNIIKKADLYISGPPARYGGKLSSVLDIRLKEGNRHKFTREATLNLENFSGFLEGPITKNTSFIFNGRTSLINLYSKPILNNYFDFVDSELKYFDLYSKLTHWFSPANRLSLSIYSGDDKILLKRNESSPERSFTDSNRINWNNTLFALNWNAALSNKFFVHGHLGRSDFSYYTESANQVVNNVAIDSSALDIDVFSSQRDYSAKLDIDYYTDKLGTLKLGGGVILHESTSSILETESLDTTEPNDSTYYSNEQFLYLETNLRLNQRWMLNTGLRYNSYKGIDTTYAYFQPRINLQYSSASWQFNLGYSRMSQFLHLLINPSSGLPANLWVPSTKKIEPATSHLSSIEWSFLTGSGLKIGLGGFYRLYNNLIEYSNPFEIIQVIVENHFSFNQDLRDVNWQDRVSIGKGKSYGVELDLAYQGKRYAWSLAYTLSKSERTFNFGRFSKNQEETFPFQYDRPHNVAFNGEYRLEKDRKINVEWLFGNGNTWTFTENVIPGPEGPLYDPKERNNLRLSSYHRLSISYSTKKTLKTAGVLSYTLGIYNVYNNKNPFYSSFKENDQSEPIFTEISLYPIFPQINIGYRW